jgi:putative exosortase-associated protein (TIGR04073 family)
MKKGIHVAMLIAALAVSSSAYAASESVYDMANSQSYGKKAGGMLGRGLVNFATCFVDIIVQTVNGTQDGPPFVGTLTGLGSGLGCTALRAGSGALDIVTFWVPGFNGIPVSRNYDNCLELDEEVAADTATPSYAAPAEVPAPAERAAERRNDAMEYVKK